MNPLVVLLVSASFSQVAALRDVPLGECHMCEVTCFEDCSLKYNREIMQDDALIQGKNLTAKSNLGKQYGECLQQDKCPCAKEEAKAASSANSTGKKALVQVKNTTCALDGEACAMKCATKVTDKAHAALKNKTSSKLSFMQRDYPIHSVQVGVFAKGHMNLAECHKFCLAATCGCNKAPGLDTIDKLFKAIKANDAAEPGEKDFSHRGDVNNQKGGAVVDTHASYQYRPAKIEECAKGMIGKKVAKGLYIDFGGGVGGEVEVCSKKMMEKLFGPGDHSKKEKLCSSTKSEDSKWGCVWNEEKAYCMVGFSPNLRCQKKFIRDPSRL